VEREPEIEALAGALRVALGLLVRRLRQGQQQSGDLTPPETSALARLDRGGPATPSALAKQEQISPQSMGATLSALEARELIARAADPADGRRIVLTITPAGLQVLWDRRNARNQRIAAVLASAFTDAERRQLRAAVPLLERLAEEA
jgi:DNA-binding MarR family transcriptional regulator